MNLVEVARLQASRSCDDEKREDLGQFLTPAPIARFMASLFSAPCDEVRLLDPGAGAGALTAAFVARCCSEDRRPKRIIATAYEVDSALLGHLRETLKACELECKLAGIEFEGELRNEDFLVSAAAGLSGGLFTQTRPRETFNCAILNPPYRKINMESRERELLRSVGIETSNLYSAFLGITVKLLEPGAELVAISPRSFCNGPYFRPFRQFFLKEMAIRRIHVFESRTRSFSDDAVLQETIILQATRTTDREGPVVISSNEGPEDEWQTIRETTHDELVRPADSDCFVRIVTDELEHQVRLRMESFNSTLSEVGASVSTGRVVDFRVREFLRPEPGPRTVPLIYPSHFDAGGVTWPDPDSRKPNALALSAETEALILPSGAYVLVKRFSSKEERKRIVAAVFDARGLGVGRAAFENHVNFIHNEGGGLEPDLAHGLAAFLNSTLADSFFRQFNGHTQVNATDLRSFRYPSAKELKALGHLVRGKHLGQAELDDFIEETLIHMAGRKKSINPIAAKRKLEEAEGILKALGLPAEQQNERSALTLLALLGLKPSDAWSAASSPALGITEMMDLFAEHYGKKYAPNSRETVRRFTIHQFVQAGLALQNPDDPNRAVNSPNNVYQVPDAVLEMLRCFGSGKWDSRVRAFLTSQPALLSRYEQHRKLRRLSVTVEPGKCIELTPGGQNVLVKRIVEEFCPHFTPGAQLIYVGDTGDKEAYLNASALAAIGVTMDQHGKMPDVLVLHRERNWLVLIEAVTSHGPVNPKRHAELKDLFRKSSAGLVFVTAFLDRKTLLKYLKDIAWETEVWVAESPTHLIHFNGERFLGPYPNPQ